MEIPIYQVDAFTSEIFRGNPAAVCPLEQWLPDATLQAIAAENNLAETAFFVAEGEGLWRLRWFTPGVEVDLCGHATLASAFVLWTELGVAAEELRFATRSGELRVRHEGGARLPGGKKGRMWLDFPARKPGPVAASAALLLAFGGQPEQVLAARDYLLVYRTEAEVRALAPSMTGLMEIDRFAVIVTAPGAEEGVDFVSRFFAPAKGVPEDPVTGSAHCSLVPYWSERLGKTRMRARQVSQRGGELLCELDGERVHIGGDAVLYLRGRIDTPA